MVGFWDRISARDRGVDSPGPGQPLPYPAATRYSWVRELMHTDVGIENEVGFGVEKEVAAESQVSAYACQVEPVHVSSIWEKISDSAITSSSDDSSSLDPSKRTKMQKSAPDYHQCFQGF